MSYTVKWYPSISTKQHAFEQYFCGEPSGAELSKALSVCVAELRKMVPPDATIIPLPAITDGVLDAGHVDEIRFIFYSCAPMKIGTRPGYYLRADVAWQVQP